VLSSCGFQSWLGEPLRICHPFVPTRYSPHRSTPSRGSSYSVGSGLDVRTVSLKEYRGRRVLLVPEAIVRYTPDDPFQPDRWWRNTADAMAVSREWFGLLNAWSGFPVKSERW
jgi:hypothetical protein